MPDQITAILSRHTGQKDELILILQEVQEELGYLPAAVQYGGENLWGSSKDSPPANPGKSAKTDQTLGRSAHKQ